MDWFLTQVTAERRDCGTVRTRATCWMRFPEFLHDCAAAVRWTRERSGADANRLVLAGHSAGAYNAAMLALEPRYLHGANAERSVVRVLIGLAGPYNFLPLQSGVSRAVFGYPDTPITTQPIHFASPAAPPSLLVTGADDDVVDPGNSSRLAAVLRSHAVPVREIVYPHIGHRLLIGAMASPLQGLASLRQDVALFLREHA